MSRDVVLVTIDCWRHDALDQMPQLKSLTSAFEWSEMITQSASTRGGFPALLHGQYYPQVYSSFDIVRSGVQSLPAILGSNGYATGAICGSNPFLDVWADDFDHFWNGRSPSGSATPEVPERLQKGLSQVHHLANIIRLRSEVPVTEIARRARTWYEAQDGPRFLWLHLMDIHVPFLPGFRGAMREGLLDTYRSHLSFMRAPHETSEKHLATLENLYWRTVERLDDQLGAVFDFIDDDATIVITGDHGEEFDHDRFGHARLYDECVRVPLGIDWNMADNVSLPDWPVQQIDIPPTILQGLGLPIPEDWEGIPIQEEAKRPAFILNHSPLFGRIYAGVRTDSHKLIKVFDDQTNEEVRTEAYDLRDDPGERTDLGGDAPVVRDLERQLESFLRRDDIQGNIHEHPRDDVDPVIQDRLAALGYK